MEAPHEAGMRLSRQQAGRLIGAGLLVVGLAACVTGTAQAPGETEQTSQTKCKLDCPAPSTHPATPHPEASATGTAARRTADVLASMGMVAHVGVNDYTDVAAIQSDLDYLGIHQIRTSSMNASMLSYLAQRGNNFSFVTLKPATGGKPPSDAEIHVAIDKRISLIKTAGVVAQTNGIEGFNELDNPAQNNNDPNWQVTTRTAQTYLRTQSSQKLGTAVAVLGPSLIGKDLATHAQKVGDLSSLLDYGNLHSYPGANSPDSTAATGSTNFAAPAGCNGLKADQTLDQRLAIVDSCISGGKPIVITETGEHNDLASTTHKGVTDRAASIYLPRTYLENFRIGVVRTYEYELLNELGKTPDLQNRYGFFTSAHQPKPAAVTLHRLTNFLADNGARRADFQPGRLDYKLSATTTIGIRQQLLQKSDGSFWLALWQASSVYDLGSKQDLRPPPTAVKLILPSAATLSKYDVDSDTVQDLGKQVAVDLAIGAQISLIKMQL